MTDFLVDNSVWARLASRDPVITHRLREIERSPADLFVTCPPQVLEFCHSARNPVEYEQYRAQMALGFPLEHAPSEGLVLELQSALWHGGFVRAAGPFDILIAGYALANDATVLTSDHDFDHLASVTELKREYVAPDPS